MLYFLKATAIAFVIVVSLFWAWYGLRAMIQHIRYKRLLRKYSRKNKRIKPWDQALSNNLPELIEDLKNRGN